MTLPPPTVLTRATSYHHDAGLLLEHLARAGLVATTPGADGRPRPCDTVLLETADVATKASRTTVAVLEASARLTCQGHSVTVEALPWAGADGEAAVERVRTALPEHVTHTEPGRLSVTVPPVADDGTLEERERLTALSTIEPLRALAAAEVDHPHLPLEAGVFAFDYLETFESLPPVPAGANTCPDYLFYDARIILVVDHPTRTATLVGASVDAASLGERLEALASAVDAFAAGAGSTVRTDGTGSSPGTAPPALGTGSQAGEHPPSQRAGKQPPGQAAPVRAPAQPAPPVAPGAVLHARPTQSDAEYAAVVETMKDSICAGDVYQVVPSRGFTIDCPHALAAYHRLRASNPSPYMFYLATADFELFGASPESALLHSAATGEVAIRPIAGTRPRGLHPDGSVDHERDTRLELELRTDTKEVAEHVMLVDLARNDVARVTTPGTRRVKDLLRVDRYSRVMHLVSEVAGQLDPDLDALDAFRASMTMGTLTGAPKLRAAELIRSSEGQRRGSYGGSVGYLRGDGELDTCIVIRSAFVTEGRALVQAGAGVVADSLPAAEAAETVHKARAVLEAVAAAQGAALVIASGDATSGSANDTTAAPADKGTRDGEPADPPAPPPAPSRSPRVVGRAGRQEPRGPGRVVLLDNRDSFVYNLVDQLASLGAGIEVYRNTVGAQRVLDALEPTEQERQTGQRPVLCLSPGPGHPSSSGCLMELVGTALGRGVPTLGICLGFQALVEACGGTVAPVGPVHGRSHRVEVTPAGRHDPALSVLGGEALDVARYHSLGTRELPRHLICLARTSDGIVMAARHRSAPAVGLQFHPESVLTPQGPALLSSLVASLGGTGGAAAAGSTQEKDSGDDSPGTVGTAGSSASRNSNDSSKEPS